MTARAEITHAIMDAIICAVEDGDDASRVDVLASRIGAALRRGWDSERPAASEPVTAREAEMEARLAIVSAGWRREAEGLRAERDRLVRVLAVERGEAHRAPPGWTRWYGGVWYGGGVKPGGRPPAVVRRAVTSADNHGPWYIEWFVDAPVTGKWWATALEAMEAAEAALERVTR